MPHVLYVGGEDHNLRIPFLVAMRDQGVRVTATGSGDPTAFSTAGIDFCPFHFHRFISPLSDVQSIRQLARILALVQPDIAQSYDTKPNLLLPIAARAVGHRGAIRTITGLAWVYSSQSPAALVVRPAYRMLHRLAARSTAATIFEMGADQSFFERGGMAGRNSIVIPAGGGGVDVEGFDAALSQGDDGRALRSELGLGAAPVVITVTRMTRQKGISTLLRAARFVHQSRPDVRFLLVGPRESEGPLAISQGEIEQHAPYVVATGARSDVPSLLKLSDMFAFPTEYREGVPRALLEASLAGLPIVTTNMPGCQEVVRDSWNGFVVPTHAPDQLARRILDVLNNPEGARRMAALGNETVRNKFGLRSIVRSHIELYDRLIQNPGRSVEPATAWG